MAQKINIELVDDVDGSAADETVRFGLDGMAYEIDLSTANASKLRTAVEKYAVNARRVRSDTGARRPARTGRAVKDPQNARIREWAAANGYVLASRGRIPADILSKYLDAQGAPHGEPLANGHASASNVPGTRFSAGAAR